MRRAALSFAFLCLALFSATPRAGAQQTDAEITQALIGTWQWSVSTPQGMAYHQVNLYPGGSYFWKDWDDSGHLVAAKGVWIYQDHWLQFRSDWSQPLDAFNRPLVQSPVQILEVGPNYLVTPGGRVDRVPG